MAVGFYPIHVKTNGSESHRERGEEPKKGSDCGEGAREGGEKKSCQVKTTRTAPINPGKTPTSAGKKFSRGVARGFSASALGRRLGKKKRSDGMGVGRKKKRRASEGEGKKKGTSGENRELVGLGRFVKIPRTTYKLHRSIAGARLESAKSLHAVRCSRVRVWAIRREVPREIQFAGERFARRVTETR